MRVPTKKTKKKKISKNLSIQFNIEFIIAIFFKWLGNLSSVKYILAHLHTEKYCAEEQINRKKIDVNCQIGCLESKLTRMKKKIRTEKKIRLVW